MRNLLRGQSAGSETASLSVAGSQHVFSLMAIRTRIAVAVIAPLLVMKKGQSFK